MAFSFFPGIKHCTELAYLDKIFRSLNLVEDATFGVIFSDMTVADLINLSLAEKSRGLF